jgi:hypothetical protein
MKHVDGNNVQRLVSVIGDEKNNVVKKHVTYKSPWNMLVCAMSTTEMGR